jgi:hypothetical protein
VHLFDPNVWTGALYFWNMVSHLIDQVGGGLRSALAIAYDKATAWGVINFGKKNAREGVIALFIYKQAHELVITCTQDKLPVKSQPYSFDLLDFGANDSKIILLGIGEA